MGVDFQTATTRIIHQDQCRPIIHRKIANADILPVATEVCESQRCFANHLQESGRPAAMLHIGPAACRANKVTPLMLLDVFDEKSVGRCDWRFVGKLGS